MVKLLRRHSNIKLLVILLISTMIFLYVHNNWIDVQHLLEASGSENYDIKADKWILLDVTDTPLDNTPIHVTGWRILVLGDSNRTKIKCSNCIHFENGSLAKVKTYLPANYNNINTKLQAVLYMLYTGAEWIFWSNGICQLQEEVNQFNMASRQTGLIYRGKGIMHPDRHFTCHGEKTEENTNLYHLSSWTIPSIQKIWRPEKEKLSEKMIDYHAPPVLIPSLTFHTEHLLGSLFHRNLSWSLALLFVTPQDHFISFWTQRLLWEFDGTTKFMPPLRKDGNILSKNIPNENAARDLGGTLGKELSRWKCDVKNTFYTCVTELANLMAHWNYFTQREVSLINVWLSLLKTIQPKRNTAEGNTSDVKNSTINTHITTGHRVVFNPRGTTALHTLQKQTEDGCSVTENPFYSVCKQANSSKSNPPEVPATKKISLPIDNILLIIIFNNPGFLGNIKYLYYMYGRHFSHILVCGDVLDEFMKYVMTKNRVSFIEVNVKPGYYGYQCMMEAMKIGYDVAGYLQMSDDVLFNVWNIVRLPRNQVWFQTKMRAGNLSTDYVADIVRSKYWWGWKAFRPALKKVRKEFSVMLQDKTIAAKIQTFLNTLELNSGNNNSAFYEASDIYYIPAHLKDSYVFFSSLFLKHKVFHEIAIPSVINGLVSQKQVVRMSGTYLWGEVNRKKYKEKYNSGDVFLHPFKLRKNFKTKAGIKFICERYLLEIDSHLIKVK